MTIKITFNKDIHWLFYCEFLTRIMELRILHFFFFNKTDNWNSIPVTIKVIRAPIRCGISVFMRHSASPFLKPSALLCSACL